ncbi:hypothetical protein NIES298_30530 [Microcystis aeruginosa NIES-298]|uniref:Uncharacterized protein n=1 Tax=Microcystis aeruginosa DA14 TaxID=1987506 RepID=A0A3E0MKV3_MICAE|nr:MAG: hypothetical protein DWQ56_03645 [Microcystis aeruginosa DA14]GBE98805.1 hypothetical protein NIES298_30530 [Microcystis aeruginosa NIES-298]
MSDPPAYRHPPYQGGQGGSNLKSIFNLIITSYLCSRSGFRAAAAVNVGFRCHLLKTSVFLRGDGD